MKKHIDAISKGYDELMKTKFLSIEQALRPAMAHIEILDTLLRKAETVLKKQATMPINERDATRNEMGAILKQMSARLEDFDRSQNAVDKLISIRPPSDEEVI